MDMESLKNCDEEVQDNCTVRTQISARVELSRNVHLESQKESAKETRTVDRIKDQCQSAVKECCRPESVCRTVVSFFPVLSWLPSYPWKQDLIPDILAGLTVGIMSIPQGMAYARLAGMPPVYGLYTNIIPTFVYFLLGTTKHAAIGPATVLSLIMSSIRYKHIPCQDCWMDPFNVTNLTSNYNTADLMLTPIDIGSAVAFLAGIFLIIMGLFRLSFISDYLPDQLVGGFTVAAAVQVFAGQLPSVFGVKMPNRNGIGKVIMNFIDLFSAITHTNVATFLIFLSCFVFLLFSKHIVNPKFQKRLKIPFPGEFIVMVVATLASHYARFHEKYQVSVVQHIAAGLPAPTMPKVSIMSSLVTDAFVLAVVTYTYSISLAKLYAKRNGYKIHTTQEFYAYGFMNFIGSFFQCFNCGQSVARSLVYEMAGARSQLCGMFGTLVVIITVLFIAPFLESLPNAALAAIIVTAVLEMLLHLRELPPLFRKSKHDFSIYLVTFISVIVLDVTYGLAISVGFALATVIKKVQRSRVDLITEDAKILCASDQEKPSTEEIKFWKRVIAIRLTSPVFYVNAEKIKQHLIDKAWNFGEKIGKITAGDIPAEKVPLAEQEPMATILILDMSSVAFMDLMGINSLKEVHNRLSGNDIELYLCACTEVVIKLMKSSGFLETDEPPLLFPTVLDGISFARARLLNEWPLVQQFGCKNGNIKN